MDSSASVRSLHYSVGTASHQRSLLQKPGVVVMNHASKLHLQGLKIRGKPIYRPRKQKATLVSCVKTAEVTETVKSDVSSNGIPQGLLEKKHVQKNTSFPNGFEALVLEVCDETDIAELKLKVGDFEMHLKRNIGATSTPTSGISPAEAPPIPTEPMAASVPATPSPPKSSPGKSGPFTNALFQKSSKLAALEASGTKGYVTVSSPRVGSFRRGRTVKGKRQPPICKEGDLIKEGQVVGYLDQFGTELPVKSEVAGEILKVLFSEGEAVGYGDPLIAILPSFIGID